MASRLCSVCQTIPFQEIHDQNYNENFQRWTLGTLRTLRGRPHCAFCTFVLNSTCCGLTSYNYECRETEPIHVRWNRYSTKDLMIGSGRYSTMRFMSGNSNTVVGLDVTEKQIDTTLIKAWLDECQACHSESCSPPPLDDAALRYAAFRLIDVQQLCVVPASVQASYVALSYVWGETTRFSLDRGNRESLMRQDGLLQSWDRIPETIRDAILLLRKMELKYLWVDCLCLVQDDPVDMDGGVQMMDAIFEHSLFTLIAASGTNSNSGLPGVRDGSRSPMQITCDLGSGLRLLLVHPIDQLLAKTKYNKRAWT